MIGRRAFMRFLGFGGAAIVAPVAAVASARITDGNSRLPVWVEEELAEPGAYRMKVLCSDGNARTVMRWRALDNPPKEETIDMIPLDVTWRGP